MGGRSRVQRLPPVRGGRRLPRRPAGFTGLKSELSQTDFVSTYLGRDFGLADLVAVVMRRSRTGVTGDWHRRPPGGPGPSGGVRECAEGLTSKRRQATAEERLQEAARQAGFEEVALLEEPAAAVLEEDRQGVAIAADFGGGTFDVAVIGFAPDGVTLSL